MINAVIADDEERICRLITILGDWERYGIRVTGTASNGIEALRLVQEQQADILITDIRMPGCDGIQLIEQVRNISPRIHIVIVSGYAEFKYAQAAVKYGVEDYLLKPINKELLNECLAKITGKIHEEQDADTRLETSSKIIETNTGAVRAALITDCLIDPGRVFTGEELRDHYHIDISGGTFQFICAKLDGVSDQDKERFIWDRFVSVFSKELKETCTEQIYHSQGSYMYGLLVYSARKQETVRKSLRNSMNAMLGLSGAFIDNQISLATGYPIADVSRMNEAFASAVEMIKERIVTGTGKVIEWKASRKVLYEKRLLEGYNRDAAGAVEVWSEEALRKANEKLCGGITGSRDACGREITDTVIAAGKIFLTLIHLPDQAGQERIFVEKCSDCPSEEELLAWFNEYTMSLMHDINERRDDEDDRYVRLAKQYISNHYAEQISLEEVSSYLGLTQAYFSTFFKKKTGIGFAKYLMNVRIDAAKVLLKEDNRPVAEICTMVGYNDLRNFNRVFEQLTGVKPAVYRKLYG